MSNKISLTLYNISLWERLFSEGINNIEDINDISDLDLSWITNWYRESDITYEHLLSWISAKMFYSDSDEKPIYQNDFLNEVSSNLPLLENKKVSFIFLIYYNWDNYLEEDYLVRTDKKLYAVAWWNGWVDISWYINNQFWFDVISRVLPEDEKNKEIIRYLENKNIIWNVDYQSRSFRKLYSIWYENSYWSIYTDMILAFDESLLEKIWITELSAVNISNKVWVAITSWLLIKKNIDFQQLQEIIKNISLLYFNKPNFSFNKLEIIKTKEDKETLKNTMISNINEHLFQNWEFNTFSIWVQDTQAYSDNLKITYWRREFPIDNTDEDFSVNILNKILEIYSSEEIVDIENFLFNLKLKWEIKNYGNILKLLETEFESWIRTHFYFLWNFYRVEQSLKDRINEDFRILYESEIFQDNHELLIKEWKEEEHEDTYNEKYSKDDNYYIFDKITPEWVEFCDILHVSDDWDVSVFHIKDWFWQSIRDLVYQVENSTSLLHDQVLTSDSEWYFKKLYESKITNTIEDWFNERFTNLEDFLELFKSLDKINVYLWIRYRAHGGEYLRNRTLVPKVAILDLQKKINNNYMIQNFHIIKL